MPSLVISSLGGSRETVGGEKKDVLEVDLEVLDSEDVIVDREGFDSGAVFLLQATLLIDSDLIPEGIPRKKNWKRLAGGSSSLMASTKLASSTMILTKVCLQFLLIALLFK